MDATICEPVGVLAIKLKGPLGYEDATPLRAGAGVAAFDSLVSTRGDSGASWGSKLTLAQPDKKSRAANK